MSITANPSAPAFGKTLPGRRALQPDSGRAKPWNLSSSALRREGIGCQGVGSIMLRVAGELAELSQRVFDFVAKRKPAVQSRIVVKTLGWKTSAGAMRMPCSSAASNSACEDVPAGSSTEHHAAMGFVEARAGEKNSATVAFFVRAPGRRGSRAASAGGSRVRRELMNSAAAVASSSLLQVLRVLGRDFHPPPAAPGRHPARRMPARQNLVQ